MSKANQLSTSKALLTSFGRLPLVMETLWAFDLPRSIQNHLPILEREGKYRQAHYIESFISVFAAGGDCLEDFELLREDKGLKKLKLRGPSPEAIRWFLNVFHEEEALQSRVPHEAFIPEEPYLLYSIRIQKKVA